MNGFVQRRSIVFVAILSAWGLIACSDASPVADSVNTADMAAPMQAPALEDDPLAGHDDAARAKAVPTPAKPGVKGNAVLKQSNWHAEAMRGIDAEQYRFAQSDSGLAATNMAHNFRARFDESGWAMEPRRNAATREALSKLDAKAVDFDEQRRKVLEEKQDPDWRFNLRFEGMGRTNAPDGSGKNLLGFAAVKPALGACDGSERKGATEGCFKQLEFRREGLTEYFKNLDEGLEHGYVIDQRPSGSEARLVVESRFEGLQARVSEDGQRIVFHDDQADRFHYEKLLVTDAKGTQLTAHMAVEENRLRILVDDTDAIYPIAIDPLATTPAWMAEANQEYANFGGSVSSAGDVNGDGYGDVIVGAYLYDSGEDGEGAAFVYLGSASGLSATPAWMAEGNQEYANLGRSVSSAGDVNGDGYDDVIVSGRHKFPDYSLKLGIVSLYMGSKFGLATTPVLTLRKLQAYTNFGAKVSPAGDVNGDGYDDVIIGDPSYETLGYPNMTDEGAAYLHLGSAMGLSTTAAWSAEGNQTDAHFGVYVSSAGDVNGDGYDDVIVGATGYDGAYTDVGRVFVYLGSLNGLSTLPAWTADGAKSQSYFGGFASSAGDVNGDGYGDVIIGASCYDAIHPDEGRAFVYLGSANGLPTTSVWSASGFSRFSLSSAGDVNNDGYDDVIVGTPEYGDYYFHEGAVNVYLGMSLGLSGTPAWTVEGNQEYANFGSSVSSAGDVNGDGYDDIIIGATGGSNDKAFVYHGTGNLSIICGDGVLTAGEECESTDGMFDQCCHPQTCQFKPAGISCGESTETECNHADTCDGSGVCQANRLPNNALCGEGVTCPSPGDITEYRCQEGVCVEEQVQLDDGDPCTSDIYDSANGGMRHVPKPDGYLCDGYPTLVCSQYVCRSGACVLENTPQGWQCGEATECTWQPSCNGAGSCVQYPKADGTACSTDNNECTTDACISGACSHPAMDDGTACSSDGNECTTDACISGACSHPAMDDGTACSTDNNECTTDACISGACSHPAMDDGTACSSDGNECTTDACISGACSHPAMDDGTACSSDGNECTTDACISGACSHPAMDDGTACDDGNLCTSDEQCDGAGTCSGLAVVCNDHGTCTEDNTCTCDNERMNEDCSACLDNFGNYPSCSSCAEGFGGYPECFETGEMAQVAAGRFWMGSPAGSCPEGYPGDCATEAGRINRETLHPVILTYGFEMGRFEVTEGEFEGLMGWNPTAYFNSACTYGCGPNHPVKYLSWYDTLAYANQRSLAEGLTPCYVLTEVSCRLTHPVLVDDYMQCINWTTGGIQQATVSLADGAESPQQCEGYRLPTEAEWEYAARAGSVTAFYPSEGNDGTITQTETSPADPNLVQIGWYGGNNGASGSAEYGTKAVGQLEPNAWGLYDMSGNMAEWVWDWFQASYQNDVGTDPVGPSSGSYRVNRGGYWSYKASSCRSAYRYSQGPTLRYNYIGFRLAKSLPASPCQPNPCGVNEHCEPVDDTAQCLCDAGCIEFEGTCIEDPCESNPCGEFGSCDNSEGVARCNCDDGYFEFEGVCIEDPCEEEMCGELGTCDNSEGVAQCVCDDGYAGDTCSSCAEGFGGYPECFETGEMAQVAAGRFWMGSPAGSCPEGYPGDCASEPGRTNRETLHPVILTYGFEMGRFEVTEGEFEGLMGWNPTAYFNSACTYGCGPNHPVKYLSWYDTLAYANQRSLAEGLTPCYVLTEVSCRLTHPVLVDDYMQCINWTTGGIQQATVSLADGAESPQQCEGYRLPTEAEWEYAARAGSVTAFYPSEGNDGTITQTETSPADPNLVQIGWYGGNNGASGSAEYGTKAVGQLEPNAWGLYDMSGNMAEWVWDWFQASYQNDVGTDPVGPSSGSYRVNRGGYWSYKASSCRSAYRYSQGPTLRYNYIGFRLAKSLPASPCQPNPCGVNEHCEPVDDTAQCLCDAGCIEFEGTCIEDPCESNPCGEFGSCDNSEGVARCNCDDGYFEFEGVCIEDPCEEEMCGELGTCDNSEGVAQCVCDDGYAGDTCSSCAEGFGGYPECFETGEMAQVAAGRFWMGSPAGSCPEGYPGDCASEPGRTNRETLHPVILTYGFEMGRFEVTEGEFEGLMGWNPTAYFNSACTYGCGPNHPVKYLSWYDTLAYANQRSLAEGLTPCYVLTEVSCRLTHPVLVDDYMQCINWTTGGIQQATVSLADGAESPQQCEGYRLPTEAEWEYAARAGSVTAFYPSEGNDGTITQTETSPADPNLVQIGWYGGNNGASGSAEYGTKAVGQLEPNAWGLYDMSGNMAEWVWDWFQASYQNDVGTDPVGPSSGSYRVNRGGYWSYKASSCRSAYRYSQGPTLRYNYIGFRLAKSLPEGTM